MSRSPIHSRDEHRPGYGPCFLCWDSDWRGLLWIAKATTFTALIGSVLLLSICELVTGVSYERDQAIERYHETVVLNLERFRR